jgi:hypothetical protein
MGLALKWAKRDWTLRRISILESISPVGSFLEPLDAILIFVALSAFAVVYSEASLPSLFALGPFSIVPESSDQPFEHRVNQQIASSLSFSEPRRGMLLCN